MSTACALAGYAVLAWRDVGRVALVGCLLGPAVLIGGPVLVSKVASDSHSKIAEADGKAAQAARSSVFRLSVAHVEATASEDGATLERVTMTVTVRADATVRFGPNHEIVAFRLYSNGAESWELQAEGPVAAGWTGFTAGQEYVFPLEFQRYDENAPKAARGPGCSRCPSKAKTVSPTPRD